MDTLPRTAWEPVTPRGVAAFSRAKWGRLVLVQFFVALIVAAAFDWLLYDAYFPTVTAALQKLPDAGDIRSQKLDWRGEPAQALAESRHISFSVDLDHTGAARSPAHTHVEFGRDNIRVVSLFGYKDFEYPVGWIFAFNRPELVPKWGAWRPPILAMVFGGVIVSLMVSWILLATIYAVPVWLLAFYMNRDLKLSGSWKLSGAALMPGALLMAASFLFYDLGWFDLVYMAFLTGAHLVLGWIYVVVSLLFLPLHPAVGAEKKNPFAQKPGEPPKA